MAFTKKIDHWSAVHSAFVAETLKNNCTVAAEWVFRWHFNIGRCVKVPDHKSIKNWVETFWTTASATNKKLGDHVSTVQIQ